MLGVDESWLPLPTRPQRYCDPTSLGLQVAIPPIKTEAVHHFFIPNLTAVRHHYKVMYLFLVAFMS